MSVAGINAKDLSVLGSGDDDFLEPKFIAVETRIVRNCSRDRGIRCCGEPFDESYEVPRKTLIE